MIVSKRLSPESTLQPDRWQELLAVVIEDLFANDEGFDAGGTAIEAGLNEEETAIFAAWCKEIEIRNDAAETSGEMRITTERMMAWLTENSGKPFPQE